MSYPMSSRMFQQVIFRTISVGFLWVLCYEWCCPPVLLSQSDFDEYESNVRPLLLKHCIKCHGPDKQESDLRLDQSQYWEAGGISGPALLAGRPEQSLVVLAVKKMDPDLSMPPGDEKLSREEVDILERWIRHGAMAPRHVGKHQDQRLDLDEAKEFWSFRPLQPILPPSSKSIDTWLSLIHI